MDTVATSCEEIIALCFFNIENFLFQAVIYLAMIKEDCSRQTAERLFAKSRQT